MPPEQTISLKKKIIVFFLIIAVLSVLIPATTYLYRQYGQSKQRTTKTALPSASPAAEFVADTKLPYPLNLPAVENVDVLYRIDGRVEKIDQDPKNSDSLLVTIRSVTGPKFPDPIQVKKTQLVNRVVQAGNSTFKEKPVSQIGVRDRLIVTLIYNYKLKKTYVSLLESL